MANIQIESKKLNNPDGTEFTLDLVTPGTGFGAIIIPITRFRGYPHLGVVRQWRESIQGETFEFPRGSTQDLSEEEALRETEEEMGAVPNSIRLLGVLNPDSGLLTTQVGVWLASYPPSVLGTVFDNPDENNIHAQWFSTGEAQAKIARSPIVCGMSMAAFFMAQDRATLFAMP